MPIKPTRLLLALPAVAFGLAVGLVVSPQGMSEARAGVEYPWCAFYNEASVGATNCGFVSYAQCAATIYGLGGMCRENPAYIAPVQTQRKPRKPAR